MSTRPFIQWPEKLWIAFQLLCGLAQIHKHGLSHGDLKLENILITPGKFCFYDPLYVNYISHYFENVCKCALRLSWFFNF